jgi:anti-anti-sigma factor
MSTFELERRETDDARIVHVSLAGELDLTNARDLEERLVALAVEDGCALLLEVSRVVFVDSAALHVLFRTARRLGRKRFLVACAPEVPIARTLRIVGLDAAAVLADTVDAALRSVDADPR